MEKYKVTCIEDNKNFVVTTAFLKLKESFKELKNSKGMIIQVIGAPGTGKSSNIYHAQQTLGLNIYNVRMKLKNDKMSPKAVYNALISTMKHDFNVKTDKELYKETSKYDAVLFADHVLDSELLDGKQVGLGHWIHKNRLKSIIFYFILIYNYLKYRKQFRMLNIIFHTTWTFTLKGVKYDLLTDFSLLSLFFKSILKIIFIVEGNVSKSPIYSEKQSFSYASHLLNIKIRRIFTVIEITYTKPETIEIIQSYFKEVKEEQIRYYIKKYGCKPRLILNEIEKDLKTIKLHNTDLTILLL